MTGAVDIEALGQLEFFSSMEPHHLRTLASMATSVEFLADTLIFSEGEISQTVFVIQQGEVSVEVYLPDRGEVSILTLGPGQLLGWSPLFGHKPNTASGRTITPVKALAINGPHIRRMCQVDHSLGCALAWRIAEVIGQRLKATRLQMLDM